MLEAPPLPDALLGGGLPSAAYHHLCAAGAAYHLDAEAERHLSLAQAAAPGHAAVLIAYYRYYFYKGRLAEALHIARLCLAKAAAENNLPSDWRLVAAGDAAFGHYEAVLPRFFLFVLKGYAYLQMRLGNLEEGEAAVRKLLELDPGDKIGAKVLLAVIQRRGEADDD
ncbi:hypothetical protein [Niveispirillum sp. SYP-B3756]|uniref:hypothetical protein n=1 Tax=Niveispirillum sp. SYP-B3756 TaxID=2662178 RepID=UPI001B3B5F94|nr:hypothetical protein [Niveispirillum sp. SYP-B3756]